MRVFWVSDRNNSSQVGWARLFAPNLGWQRLIQSAVCLVKALSWVGGSINGLLVVASGRGLPVGRRLSVQGGEFPALDALFFPLKARFWSRCAAFPLVRSRCSEDTPGKVLQGQSAIDSCHPSLRSNARPLWHQGWLISVFLSLLRPVRGCTARVRYRSVCVLCRRLFGI